MSRRRVWVMNNRSFTAEELGKRAKQQILDDADLLASMVANELRDLIADLNARSSLRQDQFRQAGVSRYMRQRMKADEDIRDEPMINAKVVIVRSQARNKYVRFNIYVDDVVFNRLDAGTRPRSGTFLIPLYDSNLTTPNEWGVTHDTRVMYIKNHRGRIMFVKKHFVSGFPGRNYYTQAAERAMERAERQGHLSGIDEVTAKAVGQKPVNFTQAYFADADFEDEED